METKIIPIQKIDIREGIPEDIEVLNSPFGYYKFLGVNRDASQDEIRRAYLRLAHKYHPDKGGDHTLMVSLNAVYRILSLSSEEYSRDFDLNLFGNELEALKQFYRQLGLEIKEGISARTRYDVLSTFDENFSAYLLGENDSRTRKFIEDLMQEVNGLESAVAQTWREQKPIIEIIREENDLYKELEDEKTSQEKKEEIKEKILDSCYSQICERQNKTEFTENSKDYKTEALKRNQIEQMLRTNTEEFKRLYNPNNDILDIYQQNPGNTTTFGINMGYCNLFPIRVSKKENVVYVDSLGDISIGQTSFISGSKLIHYKSIFSNVDIEDQNINGIIQLMDGSVRIRFHNIGPKVIKIVAPHVKTSPKKRFIKKDDLYIPAEFSDNITNFKPSLEVVVKQGDVSLFAI